MFQQICSYKMALIPIIALFFLISGAFSAPAHANPKYASIIMDSDTGMILHQRHANKKLHPASLTKVMTLLMVFEALERGDLKMNDRIRISQRSSAMQPSKIGFKPGETIRVKDAIYALVTKSANDVAVAVGEHLGGTEYNFAKMMTRRARQLGMSRTTFRNASGLHHPSQVSTARDMVKMARHVIVHHPKRYRYFSKTSFTYRGQTYRSHNRLLGSYKGVDGMKTGYINASGFNLIASAKRDNRRIIAVVFGGKTSKRRNNHMVNLLDRGFAKIKTIRYANVPKPDRKPLMRLAQVDINPVDQMARIEQALEDPTQSSSAFGEYLGQGDLDPEFSERIQAGLLARTAYQGQNNPLLKAVSYTPDQPISRNPHETWMIQIGAYSTRLKTGRAISKALDILPRTLGHGQPVVAPHRRGNGFIYRARLSGYSQSQAIKACSYFKDCLTVAP